MKNNPGFFGRKFFIYKIDVSNILKIIRLVRAKYMSVYVLSDKREDIIV